LKTNPDNIVVIDEAYIDFGGEDCSHLINKYDNLLVSMTYSKSRSMAGARLGFAIASEAIIADLNRVKYSTNPYNINRLSAVAGVAAIEGNAYYVEKIAQTSPYKSAHRLSNCKPFLGIAIQGCSSKMDSSYA
jgi:histidinol-phosphate aminotransferase